MRISVLHQRSPIAVAVVAAALVVILAALATPAAAAKPEGTTYTPTTPSQLVDCNIVDRETAKLPRFGEGPGGWRYSNGGTSFVTFAQTLDASDPDDLAYESVAGRSNVRGNTGQPNDYPNVLDLPQSSQTEILEFNGPHGVIVLSGGEEFQLPGEGTGEIRINVHDPERDGTYEGCAKTRQLTNFGFSNVEGGDFVQQELFKVYAETDDDGVVIFYEFTEISTFKNVTLAPGQS